MKTKKVNIDFAVMQKAISKAVRAKAMLFGSSIIYLETGNFWKKIPEKKQSAAYRGNIQTKK